MNCEPGYLFSEFRISLPNNDRKSCRAITRRASKSVVTVCQLSAPTIDIRKNWIEITSPFIGPAAATRSQTWIHCASRRGNLAQVEHHGSVFIGCAAPPRVKCSVWTFIQMCYSSTLNLKGSAKDTRPRQNESSQPIMCRTLCTLRCPVRLTAAAHRIANHPVFLLI